MRPIRGALQRRSISTRLQSVFDRSNATNGLGAIVEASLKSL
jgi:hypothetical protein